MRIMQKKNTKLHADVLSASRTIGEPMSKRQRKTNLETGSLPDEVHVISKESLKARGLQLGGKGCRTEGTLSKIKRLEGGEQ